MTVYETIYSDKKYRIVNDRGEIVVFKRIYGDDNETLYQEVEISFSVIPTDYRNKITKELI